MKISIMALLAASTMAGCVDEWTWENCSELYYRDVCDGEDWGDEDGWVYMDPEFYEEYFVTVTEFNSWDYC